MVRPVILLTVVCAMVGLAHAGAPRYVSGARPVRTNSPALVTKALFEPLAPHTSVQPALPNKIELSPAAPKKQRWTRESTGHAARIGLAIGTPFVAPVIAAHAPLVAGGLAVGFSMYAARGAYDSFDAGYRAAKATPRDGWWTAYDKTAAFIGGAFGSREGLGKLLIGGGIGAQFAASVFTAIPAFGVVGAELVKSGILRSVMSIFMPQRGATVATLAVADTQSKR